MTKFERDSLFQPSLQIKSLLVSLFELYISYLICHNGRSSNLISTSYFFDYFHLSGILKLIDFFGGSAFFFSFLSFFFIEVHTFSFIYFSNLGGKLIILFSSLSPSITDLSTISSYFACLMNPAFAIFNNYYLKSFFLSRSNISFVFLSSYKKCLFLYST